MNRQGKFLASLAVMSTAMLSLINIALANTNDFVGLKLNSTTVVSPSFYSGFGYEGNIALTDTDEIDSFYWQVTPSITVNLNPGELLHELTFSSDVARYTSSSADSYQDFFLSYAGEWQLTSRHRLNLSVDQSFEHQKRGSQQTRFQLNRFNEVLQFNSNNTLLAYEFGNVVARAQIGASVGYRSLNYTNFEDFTEQFDNENYSAGAWFYYRPGNVTNISFDIQHNIISYNEEQLGLQSRDSATTTFLVGAIWDGLSKTSGRFKVGAEQRRFDDTERENLTNLAVDAEVIWAPKIYSEVTMSASRRTTEGVAENDATLTTSFSVNWSHSWSEYSSSRLGYEFVQRDEQGTPSQFTSRKDNQHFIHTAYNRFLTEWAILNVQLRILMNKSNQTMFDYDNQQLSIGVTIGI